MVARSFPQTQCARSARTVHGKFLDRIRRKLPQRFAVYVNLGESILMRGVVIVSKPRLTRARRTHTLIIRPALASVSSLLLPTSS